MPEPGPLATETQRHAAAELLRRMDAQDHFLDFVKFTKPNYEANWHHEIICKKLEKFERDVVAKKSPRLMIRAAPRGGKSELASRKFPPWFLGRNPNLDVIATSYNGDLAAEMGGDARDVINSAEFAQVFEDIGLRADSTARARWATNKGGKYTAAGVGEGITGKGAHVFIVDDPYKDHTEAWSANHRKKVWNWFTTAALTRIMPGGGLIFMVTSWHEDGLDQQILREDRKNGIEWEVIDIPAIMEQGYRGKHPDDPRQPGESFWPKWWPVEYLLRMKATLGAYRWSALYQQQPAPESGGIIKRTDIRLWQSLPTEFDEVISSWDLAFKGEAESSRVASHKWGKIGARFYLLWREAEIMEFKDCLRAFRRWADEHPEALAKIVEDKANGPALQSVLNEEIEGIIMIPKYAGDSKENNLRSVSRLFEAGNVFLPDPAIHPWAEDLIEELVKFPNSPYNDDTDCVSQALRFWTVPGYGGQQMEEWRP